MSLLRPEIAQMEASGIAKVALPRINDPSVLPLWFGEGDAVTADVIREAAKAAGDQVASYAIKILMNSFFGVLGTPVCRFFNPEIANAITSFGRELLVRADLVKFARFVPDPESVEASVASLRAFLSETRAEPAHG